MLRRDLVQLSIALADDIARMVCTALFSKRSTVEKCYEILREMCRGGGVADTATLYSYGAYIPMVLRQHGIIVVLRSGWNNYYYVSRVCGAHGLMGGWKKLQGITMLLAERVVPVKVLDKLKRRARDDRPIRSHDECVELTLREMKKQAGLMWRIARIVPGGKEALRTIELVLQEAANCFCKKLLGEINGANLTGEEKRKAVVQAMKTCLEGAKTRWLSL